MKASFSTREQLGQLMMFRASGLNRTTLLVRPSDRSFKICFPATISSDFREFGTVSDTRIVSPTPWLINCSNAIRVLMIPSGGSPASVTPRCSGTSGRSRANREFTSTTFDGSESFSDTTYRRKPSESSSSQCSLALANIGARGSPASPAAAFAGSTDPQLTPTRNASPWSCATLTRYRTLSDHGFSRSW